eukprot:scaffold325656_cov91-Tisochrysis_lutea.AAC.1
MGSRFPMHRVTTSMCLPARRIDKTGPYGASASSVTPGNISHHVGQRSEDSAIKMARSCPLSMPEKGSMLTESVWRACRH